MKRRPKFQFVRPEQAVAFDPLEFQFAFTFAAEAGHNPATVLNDPTELKFAIKDKGRVQKFSFADNPLNRLGVSMNQRFRNDQVKFMSFMWRWFAFVDLMQSDVLDREFHKVAASEGEPDEIHPAVVELVGSFPVNSSGKFEHAAFVAELRKKVADGDFLE